MMKIVQWHGIQMILIGMMITAMMSGHRFVNLPWLLNLIFQFLSVLISKPGQSSQITFFMPSQFDCLGNSSNPGERSDTKIFDLG